MLIDVQVHPYLPNKAPHPWVKDHPHERAHVTADEMVMAMDAVGVDGAIAVSPGGMYAFDTSVVKQVYQAHPGRFGIVCPVNSADPAVGEVIAEWKKTPGAVAIRLMMGAHLGLDPNNPGTNLIAKAAAKQGLPVNFQCSGNLDAAAGLIERHPDTQFVLDHVGIRQPRHMPATPEAWADLPKTLAIAKFPNAAVKISGTCTMSAKPFPYDDIWDNLQRVFDAYGMDRCLWGTDWTRTYTLFPYLHGVAPFLLNKRLSDSDKARLMGENTARIYKWKPQSSFKQRHPHSA